MFRIFFYYFLKYKINRNDIFVFIFLIMKLIEEIVFSVNGFFKFELYFYFLLDMKYRDLEICLCG